MAYPRRSRHWLTLLMACAALALPTFAFVGSGPGVAQDAPAVPPLKPPDIDHGKQIATTGQGCAQGTCLPCYQCHGRQGEGSASAGFPRLSNQSFAYLVTALHEFATGIRQSDVMQQVASQLDAQSMRDVAAYFAEVEPAAPNQEIAAENAPGPSPETLQLGGTLAAYGDMEHGIQACANCHGPDGGGLPPVYPYLGGQYANYLAAQLHAFKDGSRKGDPLGLMRGIASRMTDAQMEAVAQYYASIRPPHPVAQRVGDSPLMPPPAEGEQQAPEAQQ